MGSEMKANSKLGSAFGARWGAMCGEDRHMQVSRNHRKQWVYPQWVFYRASPYVVGSGPQRHKTMNDKQSHACSSRHTRMSDAHVYTLKGTTVL